MLDVCSFLWFLSLEVDLTTLKISESFRGGGWDLCVLFQHSSAQFSLLRLLSLPSTHERGIGNRMYQFSLIPAREEPPLLLFWVLWVHPACREPSTVKCLIQPPRSFERRLLSTLTTTAPLLQLAVNFRVCSDIFSSDSRDFLWSCEMQSRKHAGAKYTFWADMPPDKQGQCQH